MAPDQACRLQVGIVWCCGYGTGDLVSEGKKRLLLGTFLWAPGRTVVSSVESSTLQALLASSHQYIHVVFFPFLNSPLAAQTW